MAVNVFPRPYYLLLYCEVYSCEHTQSKRAKKYTHVQHFNFENNRKSGNTTTGLLLTLIQDVVNVNVF